VKSFEGVLISENSRLTPGLGIDEKGSKLVLETVFGKRYTLARDRILFSQPLQVESKSEGLSLLKTLVQSAEALSIEVDLELLYESLVDQGDAAYTLRQLVETYFTETVDLVHLKAMELAVGEGGGFFHRSGLKFRPLTRAQRAQLIQRNAEAEEKKRCLNALVDRMKTLIEDRAPEDAVSVDEEMQAALDQIRTFVVQGSGPGEVLVDRLKPALSGAGGGGSLQEIGLGLLLGLGVVKTPSDLLVGRYRLRRKFHPGHLEAVEAVRKAVVNRQDLPAAAVEAFTIDDEGTEDYDDALSVQTDEAGIELGVHIADPSPYIPPGSPLDDEAYTRGTTVYLPDMKYPMFPPSLSDELLSLKAGHPRPVISFYFRFPTHDSGPGEPRIVKERLTVSRNLTYDQVDSLLLDGVESDLSGSVLRTAHTLATNLTGRRTAAGAVTFHSPELKVNVDPEGAVHLRQLDTGTPARSLVSELMILVNRAGAEYLRRHDIPAIYRAQNPPREPVVMGDRYDPVVFRREVRKMVKARLILEPEPHAGLGLPCYTQLSSPLRRFADLVMHRQLSHALEGRPVPYPDKDALLEVVVTSDMNYQTAMALEKKSKHAYTLRYFEGKVGETYEMVMVERLRGRSDVLAEFVDFNFVGRVLQTAGSAPAVGTHLMARIKTVDVIHEEVVLEPIE